MTTTSRPVLRGAGGLSCSDTLEAGATRKATGGACLQAGDFVVQTPENVRRRIRPRRRYGTGDISRTMVGIGRRPADADRSANGDRRRRRSRYDHPLRRPVLFLVVKR